MKIQEFSFGNFRSFKDIQTLNLSSARIKSKHPEIDESNVMKGNNNDQISFLKSKAIYGANASGKSNIIKAFGLFILIVRSSVKDEKVLHYTDAFRLSTETENEPSFFQLIFWYKDVKYRYGFEADDKNIYAEWLYAKPNDRELPYFIREGQKIIELDKTNYNEGNKLMGLLDEDAEENDIFRNNSLFLSTIATFGFGKLSKQLIDSFASILYVTDVENPGSYKFAVSVIGDNNKKFMLDFLKYGDIGLEDLNAIEIPPDDFHDDADEDIKAFDEKPIIKSMISTRKKFNENLEENGNTSFSFAMNESQGTRRLFELSPLIYEALRTNSPIIIDEFDARLHPLLTKKILALFNSKQNKGAQLIFTTHDTHLLSSDVLRRDQIEFVEKDRYGASHLYSLVQFKGIRNTASFEKDYIQGKYGAIPFLGDFSSLIKSEEDA